MKEYTVECGTKGPVIFTGKIIGFAESTDLISTRFSIHPYRATTTLILYSTKGGKYVCEKFVISDRDNDEIKRTGAVCSATSQVYKFFGTSKLAQSIFKMAELPPLRID